jgi:hypothetical protein
MAYRNLLLWAVVAAVVTHTFDAVADDSMRCRSNRLVNVGMVAEEIVARCGEPKSRSVEEIPVRTRGAAGASIVVATTRAERWVYERGQGQFDALLSFEDGKLVRIELLSGR